jgi:hypothetical protein
MRGIIGEAMRKACDLSKLTTPPLPEGKRERLLEAARRANWDALHGPRHLRSGKFHPEEDVPPHAAE